MGKYTEQAKLAAVKEYCAGKAGLRMLRIATMWIFLP